MRGKTPPPTPAKIIKKRSLAFILLLFLLPIAPLLLRPTLLVHTDFIWPP